MAKKRKQSDASKVREHMLSAFQFLTRSASIGTYAKDLQRSCNFALPILQRNREDTWDLVMSPWTLELRGAQHRGQQNCIKIVMGAELEAQAGQIVRQTVPICVVVSARCYSHGPPWCKHPDGQDGEAAIRRVHFDFDAEVTDWPKHHLQVGGNPQELRTAGSYYYAVAEDPSEPRVPAPPLDFVLALDLVMRSFDTGLTLPQESGWRNLVIRSEELWLKPYFALAYDKLQRAGRDVPLIESLSC